MAKARTKLPRVTTRGAAGHFGHHPWRYTDPEHRPSWKRYGQGHCELTVDSRRPDDGNRWIELHATETSTPDQPGGHGSSRSTMITLTDDAARSFYEFLKRRFEYDVNDEPAEPIDYTKGS